MNILAIDDEPLTQNFIQQVLKKEHEVHIASNGRNGLKLASDLKPELIILDVNMPGMNGYEVCQQLKQDPALADIPVMFLSAHADTEEQLKGYAAGGNDYLIKPCEAATLRAKVKVMLRYRDQSEKLNRQYQDAEKTAHIAMLGSSEIGMGMHLVEQSYLIDDYEGLAKAFFAFTGSLQLTCDIMFFTQDGPQSFFSDGTASPLEIELLEKMRNQQRIFDFQQRTFINYPNVTLLVKNMPINDPERNGRIKDLLPTVLGALSNKVMTMKASHVLEVQSNELMVSFDRIKSSLLHLTNSISENSCKNNEAMHKLFTDMQEFLPKLALDEDQETFILDHIEKTHIESTALNNASSELSSTFHSVVNTLQFIIDKQQSLVEELRPVSIDRQPDNTAAYSSNVDFF